MPGVAVNTFGTVALSGGAERTLVTLSASSNVYQLKVDVASMTVTGSIADTFIVREYTYVVSGGPEKLQALYTLAGKQVETAFRTVPTAEPFYLKYTTQLVSGTGVASMWWAVTQIQ